MEKLFFNFRNYFDSYYHGKNFRFKEIAIKHPAP